MHEHILHILSLQQVLIGLRSHSADHDTTGNSPLCILDCRQTRYGVGSKHGFVRRTVTERSDEVIDATLLRQSLFYIFIWSEMLANSVNTPQSNVLGRLHYENMQKPVGSADFSYCLIRLQF